MMDAAQLDYTAPAIVLGSGESLKQDRGTSTDPRLELWCSIRSASYNRFLCPFLQRVIHIRLYLEWTLCRYMFDML